MYRVAAKISDEQVDRPVVAGGEVVISIPVSPFQSSVARWNGTTWSSLGSTAGSFNDMVGSLVVLPGPGVASARKLSVGRARTAAYHLAVRVGRKAGAVYAVAGYCKRKSRTRVNCWAGIIFSNYYGAAQRVRQEEAEEATLDQRIDDFAGQFAPAVDRVARGDEGRRDLAHARQIINRRL